MVFLILGVIILIVIIESIKNKKTKEKVKDESSKLRIGDEFIKEKQTIKDEHIISKIYMYHCAEEFIVCKNCENENSKSSLRCGACGYPLVSLAEV